MKKETSWLWPAVTALAIVLAIAALSYLPLQEWVDGIESWVSEKGPAGYLLFVLLFIVVTLLPMPAWMFAVAAGAVFGVVWGFVLVWIGALAGETLAFLIARYWLRDSVRKLLARKPVFGAIDKALQKEGWQVVALVRLSPVIPFGLKNYLFGVTKVKLHDYVIGSGLGKIPGVLLYVFLGATGRAVLGQEGGYQWALVAVGIVATILATHLIARAAGKRLGITG
jgi:uncharacterized membrane protein YdjX (TVP38/TMEM64 family)